jgi:hypothetical protein
MAPTRRTSKSKPRSRPRSRKTPSRRVSRIQFRKLPERKPPPGLPEAPPPFRISRELAPGNYPLVVVFPGFVDAEPFPRYPVPPEKTRTIAEGTSIQIVPDATWMYVAPRVPPPFAEEVGWKPHVSQTDCIVVGRKHLAESPSITLYMDIYHEFFHILQRDAGRELWDENIPYVDSPTELEAYRFSIAQARRLGVPDAFLRQYLEVEWVSRTDHHRLLRNLGVTDSD